jgi:hypothetical protein
LASAAGAAGMGCMLHIFAGMQAHQWVLSVACAQMSWQAAQG